MDRFRDGLSVEQEIDIRGRRGAYFTVAEHVIPPVQDSALDDSTAQNRVDQAGDDAGTGNHRGEATWSIVANVNCDQTDVVDLMKELDIGINEKDWALELMKEDNTTQIPKRFGKSFMI